MPEEKNIVSLQKRSTVRFVALHRAARKYSVSLMRRGVAGNGTVRLIPYNLDLATTAVRKFKKSIDDGTLSENQLIVVTIEQGIAGDHYCTFVTDFTAAPNTDDPFAEGEGMAKDGAADLVAA